MITNEYEPLLAQNKNKHSTLKLIVFTVIIVIFVSINLTIFYYMPEEWKTYMKDSIKAYVCSFDNMSDLFIIQDLMF